MFVYRKNNDITFKLKDVTVISKGMQQLERIFRSMDITVHYEQNSEYVAMHDVNLYINVENNQNNYELSYKQLDNIIDILYLKLCANQLYVYDLQNKKKYYISNNDQLFMIPEEQTFLQYITNFLK